MRVTVATLKGMVAGLALLLILSLAYMFDRLTEVKEDQPKVDLPEEWRLIDENSLLTGYITKDNTLIIRFYQTPDDVVEFQWDGDEKDIPFETGSHINVAGVDGNIIYLTPIDE